MNRPHAPARFLLATLAAALLAACGGTEKSPECTVAADCPGADTTCRQRTCTGGVCGTVDAAATTVLTDPTPGDCHALHCDGAGGTVSVVDDADVPSDGNACTTDGCAAGVPTHVPVVTGTACSQNGGTVCGAAGACVACNVPADCGSDTACLARTCTAGSCGVSHATAGTFVSNPIAGDCHTDQCDGNGNVVSTIDDGDVPVDGLDCTADHCSGGVPSNPPLAVDTACSQSGGQVCDGAGACVGCNAPGQCPGSDTICATRTCVLGLCGHSYATAGTFVSNPVAGDCHTNQCDGGGGVVSGVDDNDLPVDGLQCTRDLCASGTPSNPPVSAGTACSQSAGTMCNASGSCVQCLTASDCGAGLVCDASACISGCWIAGAGVVAPGAANPSNPCERCQPSSSTSAWTGVAGVNADCAAGQVCAGSPIACTPGCFIPGSGFVAASVADPGNACQRCDPATAVGSWSPIPVQPLQPRIRVVAPYVVVPDQPEPSSAAGVVTAILFGGLPTPRAWLDASDSVDPNGACAPGPVTFTWSLQSKPAAATSSVFSTTTGSTTTAAPDPTITGEWVVGLTMDDGAAPAATTYLRFSQTNPIADAIPGLASTRVRWNTLEHDPGTGDPALAFYQDQAGGTADLKFATCTSNCGTAAATWTIETIEAGALPAGLTYPDDQQVSLLFQAPGVPAVAWASVPTCTFKYAVRTGGSWHVSAIDKFFPPGSCPSNRGPVSLLRVGGSTAVAYRIGSPFEVRFAACTAGCDTGTSVTWSTPQTVATSATNPLGAYLSAAVEPVAAAPVLAWHDTTASTLTFATCSGSCDQGTGSWSVATLQTSATPGTLKVGQWTSIAASGTTRAIAYQVTDTTASTSKLYLTRCTSLPCTSAASWSTPLLVASATGTGATYPSLLLAPGTSAFELAYVSPVTQHLQFARETTAGSGTFIDYQLDAQVTDGHTALRRAPGGSHHLAYSLTTGLKLLGYGR
jgi:hypothetical protein